MTAGVARLSWGEVRARRLERHGLAAPWQDGGPARVVGAICGAHAQVLSAAELSVGLRMAGGTRAQVRAALWDDHTLVKTYGLRGTVHLLPTRDLPMWTGALSAIASASNPLPEDARLTPDQTDAVVAAIAAVLADAELTVDELTEALVATAGPWAGDLVVPAWQEYWPRWRPAAYTAANRGVLCFGPNRDRKVTYTNPQRWLPGFQPTDGPAALGDLVGRYLHAYGPATPQHVGQWLAAPRGRAAELFDTLAAGLEQVEVDGDLGWVVAGDTAVPSTPPRGVRLLPYFDAYTVGCHPRVRVFSGRAAERALSGGQAGNFPVLLVDGTVAGIWHQRRSGPTVHLTVEPFDPLTPAQLRDLDDQVARVGELVDARTRLTIGTVTTGGHA